MKRCCAPHCKTTLEHISKSETLSFHNLPSDEHVRAAWLNGLGIHYIYSPDSAVVCSLHFLNDDIYEMECGKKEIVSGAIPANVQVCMICLDTDSKLIPMSKYRLAETYVKLTGLPVKDQQYQNFKPKLCVQCAQRLINFKKFREKSLRARALMMDLVEKHEFISRDNIKIIDRTKHQIKNDMVSTIFGPDHCDLYILDQTPDKNIQLKESEEKAFIKTEQYDNSMPIDISIEMLNEEDNNRKDLLQDPLKCENLHFQCTFCLEEFVYEYAYMEHTCMHQQNGDSDSECDKQQVFKNSIAVDSGSSQFATENKQDIKKLNLGLSTQSGFIETTPVSAYGTTRVENKLNAIEDTDSDQESEEILEITDDEQSVDRKDLTKVNSDKLTNCIAEFHDISTSTEIGVPNEDTLAITGKAVSSSDSQDMESKSQPNSLTIECNEKITNNSSKSKVIESETVLVDTSCSNNNNKKIGRHNRTQKPLKCDICQATYRRKAMLLKHVKIHTLEKSPSTETRHFFCSFCNHESDTRFGFVTHMGNHAGEKDYKCKICNKKFLYHNALMVHMMCHTGEKPHICKVCSKEFRASNTLVRHLRTHSGEKPHTCEICHRTFAQSSTLVAHVRRHTGEKPYTCTVCNKNFARNSQIHRHMRTHTGERPYVCKICYKTYVDKANMLKHLKTHDKTILRNNVSACGIRME